MSLILGYVLPEYNFDSKIVWNRKNICLKPVPSIQIVASVKIKIATVEYLPLFAPTKKNRAGDLKKNLKKNPTEAADVKKNPTSTSPLSLFLWSVC